MMPFAVSHEVLNRQRARDLVREAERAQRLRVAPVAKDRRGVRVPTLFARLQQALAGLRRNAARPARPSISPAG